MAKTDIYFDNKKYTVDEQQLASASALLKSHLSTVMNGSGATISLDDTVYNISSTKLSDATNVFTSYLNTIKGNGHKVVIGGVEYGIDSTKVAGAVSELHAAFGNLASGGGSTPTEERLEGDGAEYYTLAPTALSFRSTAPLNELQEVQINGVTVDPANYTLEEGSTIVTFPIDYLKTLDVGSYEVAVASDSKTVKGDFNVKAPELNEHGFYYNQPYTAYVAMLGDKVSFFVRNDGTFDSITGHGGIETGTYEISGNSIVSTNSLGTLHSTISADGMEIYCTEIATTFVLGDTSVASDEDYLYIYKEDFGGYEVNCIDKTKAEYGAIKTGINGVNTVAMAYYIFENNANLITAPVIPNSIANIPIAAFMSCRNLTSVTIPDSVTSIDGFAFSGCTGLTSITIPDSVTSIGGAFGGCTNLKSITLPFIGATKDGAENTHFGYIFGANIYQEHSKIPETLKNVVITNATSIGNYAFSGCTGLTSITIPDSVTSIGEWAFDTCTSLTSINIPDSVTTIGNEAFYNCKALTNITFNGTMAQWNAIEKGNRWNDYIPATYVQCSDGRVAL